MACGVALLDAEEASDVPFAFVAVTVNVYAVPLVKPVTVIGEDALDAVMLPGDDLTVYEVIGSLEKLGAVNETVTCPLLPAVAVPIVGTDGLPFAAADVIPIRRIRLF